MGVLETDYHVRLARVLVLARYVVRISTVCFRALSVRLPLPYARFVDRKHTGPEPAIRGTFRRSLSLRYVLHRGLIGGEFLDFLGQGRNKRKPLRRVPNQRNLLGQQQRRRGLLLLQRCWRILRLGFGTICGGIRQSYGFGSEQSYFEVLGGGPWGTSERLVRYWGHPFVREGGVGKKTSTSHQTLFCGFN